MCGAGIRSRVLSAVKSELERGVAKGVPEEKRGSASAHGSRPGDPRSLWGEAQSQKQRRALRERSGRGSRGGLHLRGPDRWRMVGELRMPARLRARNESQRAFEKAPPLRPSRPRLRPNRLDPGEPQGELSAVGSSEGCAFDGARNPGTELRRQDAPENGYGNCSQTPDLGTWIRHTLQTCTPIGTCKALSRYHAAEASPSPQSRLAARSPSPKEVHASAELADPRQAHTPATPRYDPLGDPRDPSGGCGNR